MNLKKRMTSKALVFVLVLCMITSTACFAAEGQTNNTPKNDYAGHWSKMTIKSWIEIGNGLWYEDNTIKPDSSVTRAEFANIINQMYGFAEMTDINFDDVKESDWFYADVKKAVKAGYMNVDSKESFKPLDKLTREQASVIIADLNKLEAYAESINVFADKNSIAAEYQGKLGAVVKSEILKGYADNTFGPAKEMTRAEALTAIERAVQYHKTDIVVQNPNTNENTENIQKTTSKDNAISLVTAVYDKGNPLKAAKIEKNTTPEICLEFDRGITANVETNKTHVKLTGADNEIEAEVYMKTTDTEKNDAEKSKMYIKPIKALASGDYKLTIGKEFKANNGNLLGEELVIEFKVKGAGTGGGK